MSLIFLIGLLIVSLGISFLMSGMEAGVLAINRLKIRSLNRAGDRRAHLLHGYLARPEEFLWTIMVSNALANFGALCLTVTLLQKGLGKNTALFWLCFLVSAFLLYALCDLLPKLLFRLFPTRLCLVLATPFRLIHVALSPFIGLLSTLTKGLLRWTGGRTFTGDLFTSRDELRVVMQESAQGFSSEERGMINRVLDLQNVTVRNLLIPMDKATTVDASLPLTEVIKLWREPTHSRLPVWRVEGGRRRIVGIVSLRGVLYRTDLDTARPAGDFLRPALFLEENARLEAALARMQRGGERLAIVLDRDGREIGIISLQDILKFIFGEVTL